jgi:hypothetical protein
MRADLRKSIAPATICLALASVLSYAIHHAHAQTDRQSTNSRQASELPNAIVSTHELMELFNEPLYKYLKQAMEQDPSSEEQWSTVADRGLQAAEVANLVALRKDEPAWRQMASELQQAGIDLAKAAKSQDLQSTQQAYKGLINQCNACHSKMAPQEAPQLDP